jgi:hypothetical protein
MATIHQPSARPTNKLAAATIAAALSSVSGLVVRNFWPQWYDESVWAAVTPVLVLALGYVVKDEALTPSPGDWAARFDPGVSATSHASAAGQGSPPERG